MEGLVAAFVAAFWLTWPFLWPLLLAVGLRVTFGLVFLWTMPVGRTTGPAILFAATVTVLGVVGIMFAIVLGLFAYTLSFYFFPAQPSESLVMELLSDGGLARVGVFVLFMSLSLLLFGAGVGAILWLRFRRWMGPLPLVYWVRRNAVLWTTGFAGSLILGLGVGVLIPGSQPAFFLGVGGFVTGLVIGRWVRDVAEEFEPERETAGVLEPVSIPAPDGVPNPNEWHRQTRTGA